MTSDLKALLARLAEVAGDEWLNAPCVFCSYNGPDYWQSGAHAESCPWLEVGGISNRAERRREALRTALASQPGDGGQPVEPHTYTAYLPDGTYQQVIKRAAHDAYAAALRGRLAEAERAATQDVSTFIQRGQECSELRAEAARLTEALAECGKEIFRLSALYKTEALNAQEAERAGSAIALESARLREELAAARGAALEEAARVCEKRAERRFEEHGIREPDTNASYYTGKWKELGDSLDEEDDDCAAAIRALLSPESAEGKP